MLLHTSFQNGVPAVISELTQLLGIFDIQEEVAGRS